MSDDINTPSKENVFSANDAFEINELASLNEDISPELIEQLQNKIATDNNLSSNKENYDGNLFEEISKSPETPKENIDINIDKNVDDNFLKKYKAKLNKQPAESTTNDSQETLRANNSKKVEEEKEAVIDKTLTSIPEISETSKIEELSSGKIIEKPLEKAQISYNDSLDFLDNNVKYSKYVIYIDPENTDFVESLTVKERKNLINRILREQDDIAITKRRLNMFQTVVKHVIISIITIAISIPVIYWTINASLEATINNHRRSQGIFKTLYKEKGKIKQKANLY